MNAIEPQYFHPNYANNKHALPVDIPYVLRVVAYILLFEDIFLFISALVSLGYGEIKQSLAFAGTIAIMSIVAFLLIKLTNDRRFAKRGYREGALAVVLTWLMLSLFSTLPYLFTGVLTNMADAFFETVSGYTTTGFTVFNDVEQLPKGILLWRSLMQWQGGIGIVVFTIGLSPIFMGGGGLLYNAETSGITHERFMPKIKEVAKRLWLVYLTITLSLIILLIFGGLSLFEAVCNALTTVCSGGFSTRNGSIADFHSSYIEYVIIIYMYIACLNLALFYKAFRISPRKLFEDDEFRWFTIAMFIAALVIFVILLIRGVFPTAEENFRQALFQVMSIASSTGHSTSNATEWGPSALAIFIMLMFVGGCAGSTAGGIKMSRFMVVNKNLSNEFKKRIHPTMVANVRFNSGSLGSNIVIQVLAFITLYLLIIVIGTALIALLGTDLPTSVANVVSAISNVGYSFGTFTQGFTNVGSAEKIILSFIMLAGRLEVFTFVAVLLPGFYRR